MKKILVALLPIFLTVACSSEKLDRETALKIIQEKTNFPKPVTYNVFTADPKFARRLLEAGLEEKGLLKVKRTQSLADAGDPIIEFTAAAKPFLIETPDKDKADNIQLVKIADEEIVEVSGIKMLDGDKKAEVEYTTTFKNVTPFSTLSKLNLNGKKTHTARFILYDDGWRVEK